MSEKLKRILLISGFITAVLLFGFLLYYFFFRPAPPPVVPPVVEVPPPLVPLPEAPPAPPAVPVAPVLPPAILPPAPAIPPGVSKVAIGGPTQVIPQTVTAAQDIELAGDGSSLVYYTAEDGTFNRLTADGQIETLTDKLFFDVEKATWAPSTDKAILEFPDGANILYNFTTKKQVTLPQHWEDFNFSPQGSTIAFESLGIDDEDKWLAVANPDGSGATKIEHIGDRGASVNVDWSPNNQIIASYTESRDGDSQELFFVGRNNENFPSTVIQGHGLQSQWTPRGDRLLYSVYSADTNYNPALWVVDAQGDNVGRNRKNLRIQTFADKCTVAKDSSTAYCAAPTSMEDGSGLLPALTIGTPDNFWKIDLTTGLKELIAVPAGIEYSVERLVISDDGNYLYFTDNVTNTVNKIRLK